MSNKQVVIGGKLKFKGNFQNKISQEEKEIKKKLIQKQQEMGGSVGQLKQNEIIQKNSEKVEKEEYKENPIQKGSGRILTSSKTVHGQDSKFQDQLEKGDKIIITHPQTLGKEERTIELILSNKSMIINEPFSSDLISYTYFDVQKKPQKIENTETLEEEYQSKINSLSKKIKKPEKSLLEYREKKGMWGYKQVKVELKGEMSKEQLLDLRVKKNRDKFCWI